MHYILINYETKNENNHADHTCLVWSLENSFYSGRLTKKISESNYQTFVGYTKKGISLKQHCSTSTVVILLKYVYDIF